MSPLDWFLTHSVTARAAKRFARSVAWRVTLCVLIAVACFAAAYLTVSQ